MNGQSRTRRQRSNAVKAHRRALRIERERQALFQAQLDAVQALGHRVRVNKKPITPTKDH